MAWFSDDAGATSVQQAIDKRAAGGSLSTSEQKLVDDAAKQSGNTGDAARAALQS
jgi:hypothetical protein